LLTCENDEQYRKSRTLINYKIALNSNVDIFVLAAGKKRVYSHREFSQHRNLNQMGD